MIEFLLFMVVVLSVVVLILSWFVCDLRESRFNLTEHFADVIARLRARVTELERQSIHPWKDDDGH